MALSLREIREREALKKEQKRAERMGVGTKATGESMAAKLRSGRPINAERLQRIEMAVDVFRNGGAELERVLSELKSSKKALYRVVQDELRGDWMGAFGRLIGAIPPERRAEPLMMSWPEWLQLGMGVGMNEEEVVSALKVLLVFRDR